MKSASFSLIIAVPLLAVAACETQLHDPNKIADELLPVLVDMESTKRASTCEALNAQFKEFQEAKPFKVVPDSGRRCKVVSESKSDKSSYGGFFLQSNVECKKITKELPSDLARHENNISVKTKLYCGDDGTPTMNPDSAVRLSAQVYLNKMLPSIVMAVNNGTISPELSTCYSNVKKKMANVANTIRKHRCDTMKSDFLVPGITYDAIWSHSLLMSEYDDYSKKNEARYDELAAQDQLTMFLEEFTNEMKDAACAEDAKVTTASAEEAAKIAARTCLGLLASQLD